MIRVVITGTRHGRADVEIWLSRFVAAHNYDEPRFIVGDAKGVDTQAWDWCGREGFDARRVHVATGTPSPKRFHDRNQAMVDLALPRVAKSFCLAFPDDDSRGTWDCYRRALKAGLTCHALPLIDANGRVLKRYEVPSWAIPKDG